MDRRKFLIGVGSAAAGGSALIGSGAFSQVDAQRSVTIQAATDPNAYLGLGKCNTPNGSYAHLDDDGHLDILMDPTNPTIGQSPLGEGVNSDSTSWFDRVFRICNQGKQDVCVHIEDHEEWPTVPDGEPKAGERRVEFYLGDDDTTSLIGEDNAIHLPLGECVCVGVKTRTYGLSEGDELLGDFDNEVTITADVDGDCFTRQLPECPFYGTSRSDPTAIFRIQYDADADDIVESEVGDIPDNSSNSNYPNGVAFDPADEVWYFAEEGGILKTMNEDGDTATIKNYGQITDGSSIAGAVFHAGEYYFIPQGGNTLRAANIQGDSNYGSGSSPAAAPAVRDVTGLNWSGIGLGDLAIDRSDDTLYVSTTRTNESGPNFFKVDLTNLSDQQEIANESDGDRTEYAIRSQIAFDNERLWAHNAGNGEWRIVDTDDGSLGGVVETTREFTDLTQCNRLEVS